MRIHCSVKMGLAMGVMLVSGGCAADVAGGGAPQSPRPTDPSLLVALAPTEDKRIHHRSCSLTFITSLGTIREVNGNVVLTRDKANTAEPERIAPTEVRKASATVVHRRRVAKGTILVSTKRR